MDGRESIDCGGDGGGGERMIGSVDFVARREICFEKVANGAGKV